jgi:hypothetical protein
MGRLLTRARAQAGLTELAARAGEGRGLAPDDIARLRSSDVLLVAGLADAVRKQVRGDEVRVLGQDAARREPALMRLELALGGAEGATGQELLLEVALARLATPGTYAIGVNLDALGLELAQTALAFGADVWIADLAGKRTLPLLDGAGARREELSGLIERSGRRPRFGTEDGEAQALEGRS